VRGVCPESLELTPREGRVGRLITGIVSFGNWSIDRLLGEVMSGLCQLVVRVRFWLPSFVGTLVGMVQF